MARLTKQLRARRYLQASLESGRPGLPAHEHERLQKLMRSHEESYAGVRRHAVHGEPRHFDKPLTRNEREHQAHLRRETRLTPGESKDVRSELDRELAGTLARARESDAARTASSAAGAGAGAIGVATRGGGNTLLYVIGGGLLLLLIYQLVAGKAGELIGSIVGVGTGAARAFIAPADPLLSLETALGAAPIAAGSSSSKSPSPPSSSAPAAAPNAAGYVAPLVGAKRERTDQGVDYAAAPGSAVRAIGAGVITSIYPFYQGQPAIVEKLTSGPARGRSIYYAEQLTPGVRVGQRVGAGATIASVAPSGTGLELGWASASGNPLAQSTGGYTEGQETGAGRSFSAFLKALGI